jgi:hypothetical protein
MRGKRFLCPNGEVVGTNSALPLKNDQYIFVDKWELSGENGIINVTGFMY